jgi:UDP-glucose 4-epimerase
MILIVGGAGYIGSQVNKLLSDSGNETLVLDDLSSGKMEMVKWGKLVVGSSGDEEILQKIFTENKIEAVMYFAAFKAAGESVIDPEKYYLNNVGNTLKFLKVMRKNGVNKFIFSSTASVYGNPEYTPIDEVHPTKPINAYGESKLMVEQILADYSRAYGLKYVALRYFNAAGADLEGVTGELPGSSQNLIPIVLDVAIGRKESVTIMGTDFATKDGTGIRDYIHVVDLANAHLKALDYLKNDGQSNVINLGNGAGFSVREVIAMAKEVTGKNIKVVEGSRRLGDPAIVLADSKKAEKILGWKATHSDLRNIMETAWKWNQNISSTS